MLEKKVCIGLHVGLFFMHVDGDREDGPLAISCCSGCRVQSEDLVLKERCNSESEVRFGFFRFKFTFFFSSLLSCMHALVVRISGVACVAEDRGVRILRLL